jgi:hypothetical protein
MLNKIFIMTALSLSALSVHADASYDFRSMVTGQKFLTLQNDRNSDADVFYVNVSPKGSVVGFDYVNQEGDNNFSLAQLKAAGGVVLEEQQGIKALTLLGKITNSSGQGQLTFRYVSNGMMGQYQDCTAKFMRASDGTWNLVNSAGTAIHSAKMITWSMGIKTIEGICP